MAPRNDELHKLRNVNHYVFDTETLDCTWPVAEGPEGLDKAVERLCAEAAAAVGLGVTVLILSDRAVGHERVPVPSLLAVSAVHHHLVRRGTRLRTGIVLETGEPREVHHIACLLGYGASAVNPYLLFESLPAMIEDGELPTGMTVEEASANVVAGIGKGLLKVLSKMGISTVQSYTGAQIFEAVGLDPALVDRHFHGTASRIGGVGLDVLAREAMERHGRAYPAGGGAVLPPGGVYAWRRSGEVHQWSPDVVAQLQRAVRLHPGHHNGGEGNGDGSVGSVNDGNMFKDFGDDARAAVIRPAEVDHVQVVLLDEAVEVDVDEIQARRGAPVAEQARLDVLELERFFQERVVEQVDLSDRQVVGGAPIGVHLAEQFRRQRSVHGAGSLETVAE